MGEEKQSFVIPMSKTNVNLLLLPKNIFFLFRIPRIVDAALDFVVQS